MLKQNAFMQNTRSRFKYYTLLQDLFYYNHSHHGKMRKNYHLEKVVEANMYNVHKYVYQRQ